MKLKQKILVLLKKPFLRNILILTSGTAAAQSIGMLLSPIITRLYGPEAYGLMGSFTAIITIIAPVAALTLPIAIVLPKKSEDANGLIKLSLYITFINAILITLFLFLFHEPIVKIFKLQDISSYLFLIPIVILLAGITQISEQWLIRLREFGVSAKVTLLQSIIVNGGKISVGIFYPIASVLIIFTVLSHGLKAILMIFYTRKSNTDNLLSTVSEKTPIRMIASKYRDFPFYRAPQVLLNAISHGAPVLLLSGLFGPSSAGFYALSRTVLSMPLQLIGKSVGDVFYPRFTEAVKNGEDHTKLLIKSTYVLAIVSLIPFGIVIAFGPWLFEFVFGTGWEVAGEYSRWIALWSFFALINRPVVSAIPVLNLQSKFLIYEVVSLLVRIVALFIAFTLYKSDIYAIATFSVAGALLNILLITFTIKLSKSSQNRKVRID